MLHRAALISAAILGLLGRAPAQDVTSDQSPSSHPTTLPALAPSDTSSNTPSNTSSNAPSNNTAPVTRRTVTAPRGFEIYVIGDYRIMAEPADEPWIRAALLSLPAAANAPAATGPATSPATRPAGDIAGLLRQRRDELIRQLTADLALADQKTAADFVDSVLTPKLQALADLKVPLVFMVTTRQRLTGVVTAGWDEDRFHLNRASGEVGFDPNFELTTDRPMDDLLVPAVYDGQLNANDRGTFLKAFIASTNNSVRNEVVNRSAAQFNAATINFMLQSVINPLKLRDDQRWFAQGVTSVLGAKYLAEVLGVNRDELLANMVAEPPGGMSIGAVDLLHPLAMENLKRAFVPIYLDATRRKSAIVVHYWLKKSGEDSIARVLTAIRPGVPADGPALVNIIKEQTGQDLTDLLRK